MPLLSKKPASSQTFPDLGIPKRVNSSGRWYYLPYGPFPAEDIFRAYLRECAAAFDPIHFAICNTATGQPAGMASFMDIQPKTGVIEIGGIWFCPALQRTRAATEALFLMLAPALDDLGYRRMQWRCNAQNAK